MCTKCKNKKENKPADGAMNTGKNVVATQKRISFYNTNDMASQENRTKYLGHMSQRRPNQ